MINITWGGGGGGDCNDKHYNAILQVISDSSSAFFWAQLHTCILWRLYTVACMIDYELWIEVGFSHSWHF